MSRRRTLIFAAGAVLGLIAAFLKKDFITTKHSIAFGKNYFSNLLLFLIMIALILGAVRVFYAFRARAMRRFATRWGLRYVGPTAPPQWWWNTFRPIIPRPLPGWFSYFGISQAWNIIEGENNGASLFIFDGLLGSYRSHPCTYIVCQTEQSPFPITTSIEPVKKIRGWTALHGVCFFGSSWFMTIRRLDRHLIYLRS